MEVRICGWGFHWETADLPSVAPGLFSLEVNGTDHSTAHRARDQREAPAGVGSQGRSFRIRPVLRITVSLTLLGSVAPDPW